MEAEQQFPTLSKVNDHFDSQISNQFLGAGSGYTKATENRELYYARVYVLGTTEKIK